MKKVCHITTVHNPFDTRIFHKEAKTLAKDGFDVTVIAPQDNKQLATGDKRQVTIIDGVKIISLPKPKNRLSRMFCLTKKAYKLALKQEAEIYHFHDPEFLPWAVKLKKKTKAKVIYDVHEDVPQQILSKEWIPQIIRGLVAHLFNLYEKNKAKNLDFIIAATPDIEEKFKEEGIKNTEVVANYPILEYFQQITNNRQLITNNRRQKEIKLIYVGGLTRTRGIREMVKSLGYLKDKKNKLILIGKFQELGLEKYLKIMPEWKKVEFKGWLSQTETYENIIDADIGLICLWPTPNYINSIPNKLFEYMVAGLPVIASNFPLWIKIIKENHCGLIVNPKRPGEIAKAIEYLIEHSEEAKKMGENGRKAVLEKYNWEIESRKLLDIYKNLSKNTFIHSITYREKSIFNIFHKERLNNIVKMILELDTPVKGKWADFGCSDGFILNTFHQNEKFKNWEMYGFDRSKDLLQRGKSKYPNFHFNFMNLNNFDNVYKDFFDIVSCFETLEHLGDYKIGFDNLYFKLKPKGFMIISVPNEMFLVGLIKFVGRYIRGDAYKYKKLLKNKREEIYYFFNLLLNKDIEKYRKYPARGFGPHLGFNYKNLGKYIQEKYIKKSKLVLSSCKNTFLGFNKIYVFKKNE